MIHFHKRVFHDQRFVKHLEVRHELRRVQHDLAFFLGEIYLRAAGGSLSQ